jgi:hypothetical protein
LQIADVGRWRLRLYRVRTPSARLPAAPVVPGPRPPLMLAARPPRPPEDTLSRIVHRNLVDGPNNATPTAMRCGGAVASLVFWPGVPPNDPHPHAPDPTATPKQSARRTGHTPPGPRPPAASNAHEASYEQPRNPSLPSSWPPSELNPQKRGRNARLRESRGPIRAQNTPRQGLGSRSSSPSNTGQCSIRRSRPRLPNHRLLFRAPAFAGTGGWSSRSRP